MHALLFWVLAVIVGVCAIGVVVTQNIVRSATWLLFTLAGTAGLFFLLGADFVGATQLLVYVGGTLVLVVFGVMLTAQGPFINLKTSAVEWAVTTVVGFLLFGVLAVTLWSWHPEEQRRRQAMDRALVELSADPANPPATADIQKFIADHYGITIDKDQVELYRSVLAANANPLQTMNSAVLGESMLGLKQATPVSTLSGVNARNVPKRTQMAYLLPFEIVSVHLLVVLIGAAYLARAKRRRGAVVP